VKVAFFRPPRLVVHFVENQSAANAPTIGASPPSPLPTPVQTNEMAIVSKHLSFPDDLRRVAFAAQEVPICDRSDQKCNDLSAIRPTSNIDSDAAVLQP
jgi:hypothetical protein